MRILVYSETSGASVAANLGMAEYSYFFILDKYQPVLEQLGRVQRVEDPELEVDALYEEARREGERCVFLSFTPPHRTARNLRCPTVAVLAWEFDRIPNESWDDNPWNDWVRAIREIGAVVTISDYATRIIRRQVGRGVLVETVPAPIAAVGEGLGGWRSLLSNVGHRAHASAHVPGTTRELDLEAGIIDTRALAIDAEGVSPLSETGSGVYHAGRRWEGDPVSWDFSLEGGGDSQYLLGFYEEEHWGSWSKTARPSVILPWLLTGPLVLDLEVQAYGDNVDRELRIVIGRCEQRLILPASLRRFSLAFEVPEDGATRIQFYGLAAIAASGARDHRTLGLGLASLRLRRPEGSGGSAAPSTAATGLINAAVQRLQLDGTVYTSVFNPVDGRKNWEDMVTAFCWAFRDDPRKTLVLKMSHHNRSTFLGKLLLLFSRLSPFRCRIVALHGFLPDQQLRELMSATDFFVNTSLAEGQCLPLLEFMAEGVPAISPDHTAMATYINDRNSYVVRSSEQPHIWPNDPRRAYRTVSHRIDWDDLRRCYLASAEVTPDRYQAMSQAASSEVRRHYSTDRVYRQLRRVLRKASARRGA
ncbi:DUF7024 domain-containing protein [Parahaliea mediterranea]|uniref:Glycosyltransferase n=1 Tax=Parahaliea mediterranea TaxID=651086 RepID=A0A939DCR4_9GAMM|nr:glycosyltransferase [Parahaliea mediterranea]MBN7795192.1 glycosyltransferase [Parahaliea mediterranea]